LGRYIYTWGAQEAAVKTIDDGLARSRGGAEPACLPVWTDSARLIISERASEAASKRGSHAVRWTFFLFLSLSPAPAPRRPFFSCLFFFFLSFLDGGLLPCERSRRLRDDGERGARGRSISAPGSSPIDRSVGQVLSATTTPAGAQARPHERFQFHRDDAGCWAHQVRPCVCQPTF
jgi:hypothetical protein